MIQVSEDFKNAFLSGHQKNLTLTFDDGTVLTNSDIVYESFEIDQAICREQEMTFGVCTSSCMKVDIFYTPKSYVGLWCEPAISTEMNGRIYSMTLGKYKIDENSVSDNHNVRTLVGYDSLYDVLNTNYADWYKNLALPMTLKNVRNSFFNHIGITQVSVSLPNDNVIVEKTIEADTLSGSEILQRIMEINAAFGFINYEGKFKYLTYEDGFGLYPAPDLYPQREGLYPVKLEIGDFSFDNADGVYVLDTLKYEDYVTSGITGVKIRQDDEDGGVIVGTDTNLYMITGNFFLFGKEGAELTQIANRFMDYVDYMEYLPAQFSARAHIWIEPGDIVSVQGRTTMVMFPVFERTLKGITALYDEYRALGSEYYTDNANNTTNMIQNLKSKTLRIRQDIDEVSSELTQTEEKLENNYYTKTQTGTIIEQTVERIEIAYTQAISNAKNEVEEYTDNKITIDNSGVHLKAEKGTGQSSSEVTLDLDVTYKPGTQEREAKLKVTADNISMTAQQTIDLMSGGTINLTSENMNIQSNNFSVTNQGAVTASSLTLTGGSISLGTEQGQPVFSVDNQGNLTAKKGTFSGNITGGSININNKFSVNSYGNMTAEGSTITGGVFRTASSNGLCMRMKNGLLQVLDDTTQDGIAEFGCVNSEGYTSTPFISYWQSEEYGIYNRWDFTPNGIYEKQFHSSGSLSPTSVDQIATRKWVNNAISGISMPDWYAKHGSYSSEWVTPNHIKAEGTAKLRYINNSDDTQTVFIGASSGDTGYLTYCTMDFSGEYEDWTISNLKEFSGSSHGYLRYVFNENNEHYQCVGYTTSGSKREWKKEITDITNDDVIDPHKLYELPVRQFKYKEDCPVTDESKELGYTVPGFIAEEVDTFYTRACIHNLYGEGEPEDWDPRYIIPPMLKLIQEQNERIKLLEHKIAVIEDERL